MRPIAIANHKGGVGKTATAHAPGVVQPRLGQDRRYGCSSRAREFW